MNPQQAMKTAGEKIKAGQWAEAEAIYRRLIGNQGDFAPAHHGLANLLYFAERYPEAIESYKRVLALQPADADAYSNLGNAYRANGQTDEAIALLKQSLRMAPFNTSALCNLALSYADQWNIEAALACFGKAIALKPGYVKAIYNLAIVLEKAGRRDEAVAAYRKVISLDPSSAVALANLGGILVSCGGADEALAMTRRAIEIDPKLAVAHSNLGSAYWSAGRCDLATEHYHRAMELAPEKASYAGNCSYISYFQPQSCLEYVRRTNEAFNRRFVDPLKESIRPHDNERSEARISSPASQRRLRVGYVSPHFRAHAEAAFILPLIEHHDGERVEVFCYSDVNRLDAVTQRLKNAAALWRETFRLSDVALAELIRADRIDILVDLTMHMNGSRLQAFARKPAPIQVAYLAYPGTTGVRTMDYRFTDAFVDPPGMFDDHYTEQSIRLPRTFACYDPEGMEMVANAGVKEDLGSKLPGRLGGNFVFGCLNNFSKVNDRVLELWSRVLKSVADSWLHLLAPAQMGRDYVMERLGKAGVDAGRIVFIPKQNRAEYMNEYRRIDICLDTLPYCGHTTTLDALWMGVPVVTRVGETAAGRVGWSVLNNLGLTELAAHTDEEFASIAIGLAGDGQRLGELHGTLRRQLADSPVMDGAAFARDVEAAYGTMWHGWLEG